MSDLMKKMGAGSYLNVVAAVLGVVGLVLTIVSSTMSSANALLSLGTCVVCSVIAILLCLVAVFGSVKLHNDYVRAVSVLAAIALQMYVMYNAISERILMIAGLFSYNSMNTEGWQVFYVLVVGAVALVASCVCLIVGSFLKSTKE